MRRREVGVSSDGVDLKVLGGEIFWKGKMTQVRTGERVACRSPSASPEPGTNDVQARLLSWKSI
jgi:hypothetical protein